MSQIPYPIHIGIGEFNKIFDRFDFSAFSKVVWCIDPAVKNCFSDVIADQYNLFLSDEGEAVKSIYVIERMLTFFQQHQLDRQSLVIAIGGGAVGDAVGFAASIYMRGISTIHIPTTLLSMVDSSVGGKTAINFGGIKNLVGTFHPPVGVLIDPQFLSTLDNRQLIAGFAEILKHGIIADKGYFELCNKTAITSLSLEELSPIITKSVQIKSKVVSEDPKESGIRKILNFGHTLGHVIESCSQEQSDKTKLLLHGEAIAIGMLLESKIAESLFSSASGLYASISQSLSFHGLPTQAPFSISWEQWEHKVLLDKKNRQGKVSFSLPDSIGSCQYNIELPLEDIKKFVTTGDV